MRDCFGDGRVVQLPSGGYGIEALGIHKPLTLAFEAGAEVDLSTQLGQVLTFVGQLQIVQGNQEDLALDLTELQVGDPAAQISPVWAVFAGNLGKAPEVNPKGDRVGASLAYANGSWLRLAAYPYFASTDQLKNLDGGKSIVAYGTMETYEYKDKDRLQLAVRGFGLSASGGGSAKKPTVLYSRTSGDAVSTLPADDAFTAAA